MQDYSISRRGAMGVLAGGAAAAALEPGPAAAYNVRVRENITTFAANPTKLAALKTGVQVMKQRSTVNADDPTGWNYWASSHGTLNPVPPALINIYNQCQHGTTYFFPWHRAFLYYFEQTLRAASGDPTFNLPYWNWYSTPTIPAAFTTPADGTNPLYHPRANNTVNGLSQTPFTRNTFYTAPPPPPFPGFSGDLEYDPHGAVHDDVGGDMGFIETSAIDPIFWLHHCNVDRLWNVWMNAGHANPTGAWLNQPFVYNVAGTMKKTAGQVTNSVTMLSYKYDQETTPLSPHFHWNIVLATLLIAKPFVLPGPGPVEHVVRPEMLAMTQGRNAKVASALGAGFTLGAKSGQINFALSPPDLKQVMSFAASPRPPAPNDLQDVDLVLDGVQIAPEGRRGGYSYRVCVGIPPGAVSQEVIDRQCVGQFGSFEISVAQKHMRMMGGGGDGAGVTLRFPLGTALKAVGDKALRESVPVTFVARHASAPAGQGDHTYVTIKGAHLELAGAR